MGSWGTGPFDGDNALDYLADLAGRCAVTDTDGEVGAGTVRHGEVAAALTATFDGATRPATQGEDRFYLCTHAYAAAGLVAAALTGHAAQESTGTRLFTAIAGELPAGNAGPHELLGLGSHCGYGALLDPDTAHALKPAALQAVQALRVEGEWVDAWTDPVAVLRQLRSLESILT